MWTGEGSISVVKAAQVSPPSAPLNTECEIIDGKSIYKGVAVGCGEFTFFFYIAFVYNVIIPFRIIGSKSDMLQLETSFLEGKWHPFPSQCDADITEDIVAVCHDQPSSSHHLPSNEGSLSNEMDQAACK